MRPENTTLVQALLKNNTLDMTTEDMIRDVVKNTTSDLKYVVNAIENQQTEVIPYYVARIENAFSLIEDILGKNS